MVNEEQEDDSRQDDENPSGNRTIMQRGVLVEAQEGLHVLRFLGELLSKKESEKEESDQPGHQHD
ncbi:MAG: hypothetical protein GTO63_01570, partial [Anaerolineae bacterium]|nr:hypothetical protein [Anaerolineae bacterium]